MFAVQGQGRQLPFLRDDWESIICSSPSRASLEQQLLRYEDLQVSTHWATSAALLWPQMLNGKARNGNSFISVDLSDVSKEKPPLRFSRAEAHRVRAPLPHTSSADTHVNHGKMLKTFYWGRFGGGGMLWGSQPSLPSTAAPRAAAPSPRCSAAQGGYIT